MPYIAVKCPSCGADLQLDNLQATARCGFCSSSLALKTAEEEEPAGPAVSSWGAHWDVFLRQTSNLRKPGYTSGHLRQAAALAPEERRGEIVTQFDAYMRFVSIRLLADMEKAVADYRDTMARSRLFRVARAVLTDLICLLLAGGLWAGAMALLGLLNRLVGLDSFSPLSWAVSAVYVPLAAAIVVLVALDPNRKKAAAAAIRKARAFIGQATADAAALGLPVPDYINRAELDIRL